MGAVGPITTGPGENAVSRFEGVDTVVLFDGMAYEDVLSVRWSPLSSVLSVAECAHFAQRNLKVLQVCSAAESQVAVDAFDDKNPYASDLHRIEVKLNMALEVLGQLMAAPPLKQCDLMLWVGCGITRKGCLRPELRVCCRSTCKSVWLSR